MTPVDLLIETGEELHGPNWIPRLAEQIDINETTIRYWVNGKRSLPEGHPILDKLCDHVELKIARLILLKQKFLNPGDVLTLASRKSSPQR
jgi:transposase-like protein